MQILNSYIESDYLHKGILLKASDWVLTPCRKAFNGKKISVLIGAKEFDILKMPSGAVGFKKVLWTILAVATIPLAAVAAFFKLFACPTLGTNEYPMLFGDENYLFNNFDEVILAVSPLKENRLLGHIKIWFALTEEQKLLPPDEASNEILNTLKADAVTGVYASNVHIPENSDYAILRLSRT